MAGPAGVDLTEDGRAVAPFDFDGDGRQDLAVLSLQGLKVLHNQRAEGGWIGLRLEATRSQKLALGAEVVVRGASGAQLDRVRLTAGFHTQVSPRLHFGLGADEEVRVEVRWPGGVERFGPLRAGRSYRLREGGGAEAQPSAAWPASTRPRAAPTRLTLQARTLDGAPAPLGKAGRATVLNFWAPWCEACKREVPALAGLTGDFDLLGVSVETKDVAGVRAFVQAHGMRYGSVLATDEVVRAFFGPEGKMSLPATFVFDRRGALRRSYAREIDVEELKRTLATLEAPSSAEDLLQRAAGLARRDAEAGKAALRAAMRAEPRSAAVHLRAGELATEAGWSALGVEALERCVSLAPKGVAGWRALAEARAKGGDLKAAGRALQGLTGAAPKDAGAHVELGALRAMQGANRAAARSFEAALAIDPRDGRTWAMLARVQDALGQAAKAAASRRRAEQLGTPR